MDAVVTAVSVLALLAAARRISRALEEADAAAAALFMLTSASLLLALGVDRDD